MIRSTQVPDRSRQVLHLIDTDFDADALSLDFLRDSRGMVWQDEVGGSPVWGITGYYTPVHQ